VAENEKRKKDQKTKTAARKAIKSAAKERSQENGKSCRKKNGRLDGNTLAN